MLIYDPTCPSCLRWTVKSGRANPGDPAGYLQTDGYWRVGRAERKLAHVLVWLFHNEVIPEGCVVDHKDGNRGNNKIENLRCIPSEKNYRNVKRYSNNQTGFTGVTIHSRDNAYVATWNPEGGVQQKKQFSISKYGEELAEFLAVEYRSSQIDLLNLRGFGYTERHGK